MGKVKEFFKHKILGLPESQVRDLNLVLPSEEDKRKTARIRLQNEKIRDQSIVIRNYEKQIKKIKREEDKTKEEKLMIKSVLDQAKKKSQEVLKTKAIYRLVYPHQPFIQYSNGKRRRLAGFEINETKEGVPLFRLRFYSPELKQELPLQLDAQELTFFFKNIIGLATQHNTGIIPLNVDEIDGKPVFINSEIDFIKRSELVISRLINQLAKKDKEISDLRGKYGTLNELQAEQEKDLADKEMALRYSEKDAENKAAKLENVMQINLQTTNKLKQDHVEKGMTELKAAQSLRTLQAYEDNNQTLNQKLSEAYSSDAYELGKNDMLELMDRITKNILSVQSATTFISSPKQAVPEPKQEPKK